MKHALVLFAGLALWSAAPATARALPAPSPVQVPVQVAEIDKRLDEAWANLNAMWMSGAISDKEFQLMTDLLLQAAEASKVWYPDAGTIRYRLQAALDDLKARAARASYQAGVANALLEQIIDSRVNRDLAQLKGKLLAGGATRDDWKALSDQILKRAEAAKDDAEASTVADRLKSLVDALQKKAMTAALTAADFKAFEDDLAEERVHRTVVWIKVTAFGKKFTHFDFVRVSDVVRDRGGIQAATADTLKAYQEAIDRLEQVVGNDQLTPDEFKKFMTSLNVRVRGALK